jgi:hypothetical protein
MFQQKMSVLLRRSAKPSNDPTPPTPKRGQPPPPIINLNEPRDPEAQQDDKAERPTIFYKFWPWNVRFYTTPSFHHLLYGLAVCGIYKMYLMNAWFRTPIKLYIMHDGKQVFQYDDNIFTFSTVVLFSIACLNFAISMVSFVFNYYQAIHIREVNVIRAVVSGTVDALCCFVCNAHFGLHDGGSLLGCAFLACTVSLFALISEHFSYYSALFVSVHQRALPAIETYAGTIFGVVAMLIAWFGPLARALGAHQEGTQETNPTHILEIFATIAFRVLVQAFATANLLSYSVVEKVTWLLIILQLASFAVL